MIALPLSTGASQFNWISAGMFVLAVMPVGASGTLGAVVAIGVAVGMGVGMGVDAGAVGLGDGLAVGLGVGCGVGDGEVSGVSVCAVKVGDGLLG